ncbi:hypothetical protein [Polaribacter sp. AHE13PA]|jgi:hypothetical protein|uniref:hypothetical protein n=1 Tax=Polaribacter sp. AHE13PA TaxID=2745562 RepID=UPI001C4ED221|nr:hypothetical protein [Polaribacter sp. AHE13PA]QXP65765.1 hypothetical protein H0I28_11220 [Polaribacter sp. AHE13PA]
MNSVFREKITRENYEEESNSKPKYEKTNVNIVTHDNGIPRARTYSLQSELHFTEFKGYSIKHFMETDFNYFTWLPRNIENFRYDKKVLEYAKTCIDFLEKIESHPINKTHTDLGKAISQINYMLKYEHCLDYENDKIMLRVWKSYINVEYYKTILNTPLERLIRQSRKIEQVSSEYRRKYYNEIIEK